MPTLPRLPKLVQLAGQAAGGAHHDCVRRRDALHSADHLRIRWQFGIARCGDRGDILQPALACARQPLHPCSRRAVIAERGIQRGQSGACVGDQRQHVMLGGIERLHVQPDQLPRRITEQCP